MNAADPSNDDVQWLAYLYGRVSSDPHRRSRSVADQLELETRHCERHGWQVAGIYKDNDRSASRYARREREDWTRLVNDLTTGTAPAGTRRVLVVWEISRASRDLLVSITLLDSCRRNDVCIHVLSDNRTYNPRQRRDWKTLAEDSVDAADESDKISDRVNRGILSGIEAGRPHGRLPFGWRREYDPASGKPLAQVVDDDQAKVVRDVARRVAAGEALYSIAKDYNDRGIPSPGGKRWDINGVRQLVLRPGNIARRTHLGQDVGPGQWPAILDEVTYYTCVRILKDPSRLHRRDGKLRHLLSGLCLCGVCSGMMRVRTNQRYPTYVCIGGVDERQFCVGVNASKLERIVEAVMIERLSQPDLRDQLTPANEDAVLAMQELEKLRAELEGWYDDAADGRISRAGLARIEARMQPRIAAAERRCSLVALSPLVDQVAGPGAPQAWGRLDLAQRRELIKALVVIRVYRVGKGVRLPDPDTATVDELRQALHGRIGFEWVSG